MNSPREPFAGFVPPSGLSQPPASIAELQRRAATLLPEIAEGSAQRERERILPYAQIRRIAEAGLYTWRVPFEHGGPGGTITDLIRFVIEVAAVDSNIAQALRPGFGFVESLLLSDVAEEHQRWYPRVLAGEIFGNAGWERGGANGAITTTLLREGNNHYRVNGLKYYSTGALYADWISTFAIDDEGQEVAFVVPRGRAGLGLIDDFDAMGQRLTASGTTRYENVRVELHERRAKAMQRERRSPIPPLYQLYLAAVLAGIAKNALSDAVHFTRHHARPIRHSTATRSVDDPYVQLAVGEIGAQAYAAEAVVLKAAAAIDAAWAGDLSSELLTTASVEVAQTQFFAAQAALRAAELVFDVGSASTTAREHNLDRHWRNARTVANHNPRHWKAAATGAWHLSGTEPPTSGLF